jgi:hypothetical protein
MDDIYIPENLDDALNCILSTMSQDDKDAWKSVDPHSYHFNIGMSARNNWGLWSGIIFDALHSKLNDIPFDLEKEVQYYQDYWGKLGYDKKGNKK